MAYYIENNIKDEIIHHLEQYDWDHLVNHIIVSNLKRNFTPQDIFNQKDLEQWAEDNNYLKK